MAINKNRIKNTLTSLIEAAITDDMIEDAIINNLCVIDIRDKLENIIDGAVEYRIEDYISDMLDECVGDAVENALSGIFN